MEEENGVANFSLLPEDILSDILSLTSPCDACRASAISVGFKSAADSDAVWEGFLPPDHREIIARSVSPVVYDTKKQLYFLLSDSPILIDGGKMSFMLNKRSGKKCYMLNARELSIAWQDEPLYWKWAPIPESRFSEVAELRSVCWLDIRGMMRTGMLSPNTTYAAYLVFKLRHNCSGLDAPAITLVRLVGGREDDGADETDSIIACHGRTPWYMPARTPWYMPVLRQESDLLPQRRMDGWLEIELGEFFNDQVDDGEVEMILKENKHLKGKRGIIIEGMELRPRENREYL